MTAEFGVICCNAVAYSEALDVGTKFDDSSGCFMACDDRHIRLEVAISPGLA